jgi:cellulose 1,4-beta-cellobiosidase
VKCPHCSSDVSIRSDFCPRCGQRIGASFDQVEAAVQQDAANGAQPVVITIVIYDLPNRDCAALASNGELLIAQDGLNRYKTEYIDPIRAIMAQPAYANLRLSLIIEPDSLPNLVTNLSTQKCAEANQTGGYVDGVRYAISQLSSLSNTYLYLDVAHSGWLGWNDNFNNTFPVFDRVLSPGQGGVGYDKIAGFITNTANYTPTEELFLPNPQLTINGQQLMSATFYEFNPRFDERDFASDLLAQFQSRGRTAAAGATRAAPASAHARAPAPGSRAWTPSSGSSRRVSPTA